MGFDPFVQEFQGWIDLLCILVGDNIIRHYKMYSYTDRIDFVAAPDSLRFLFTVLRTHIASFSIVELETVQCTTSGRKLSNPKSLGRNTSTSKVAEQISKKKNYQHQGNQFLLPTFPACYEKSGRVLPSRKRCRLFRASKIEVLGEGTAQVNEALQVRQTLVIYYRLLSNRDKVVI